MFDVLIRGGGVVDGAGGPPFRADVGVRGGRIVAVGVLEGGSGREEIDASGRYVLPGFIDAHVHGDAAVLDPAVQLAALRQGITTFVLGQDGLSFAPAGAATVEYVSRYFGAVNGRHPGAGEGPVSVAELLESYDRRVAINTVYLVPHGTVRYEVMGAERRSATKDELAVMRGLVERGLSEGAAGLSTGLEYAPGGYADAAEIAALCGPVAEAGLPYVTHMRGYEAAASMGMAEVREIVRGSGVAAHVSHYHGPGGRLIQMVEDAHADGVDLTFDSYPYLRGCSILAMVALPPWLPAADLDGTIEALAAPDVAERLEREWFAERADLWSRITLAHVPADELRWAEGMDFPDAARQAGMDPVRFCREVLIATRLEAGCVFGHPPAERADGAPDGGARTDTGAEAGVGMDADGSMRALLRHPAQMAGSDGIYLGGRPHPRGWGAFARFLARHVRELGDWTWAEAAPHMSGNAARRFGLRGRGFVRLDHVADLVVLDPDAVTDQATYEHPRRPATGVEHVLVGGVPVLAGGALTRAAADHPPGRALRPG